MATAAGIVAAGVLALVAWRFIGQESTPESPASAPAASAQAGSEATPAAPAQAPAPVRAQESAPASVPVPVPTTAAIAAVLAQVPCSALAPAIRGHAVEVQGFLPKSVGPARLKEMLGAVPGVSEVNLSVQQVDPDKCAVISTFAPYWVAHRRAGDGVAIRLAGTAADARAVLTEGDSLMVDITTANAESFVSVDYFALDSSVVHLLPNPRARENRAPARHNATVGSMGEWGIGKPFGNELVVLLTTPVPLFDTLRPVSESGAAYLKDVAARLEQIRARNGGDKIAVDFLQISTQARKR
jgi:hypothetical protein